MVGHVLMISVHNDQIIKKSPKLQLINLFSVFQESTKSLDAILGLKTLARNVKKITGTNNSSQENLDDSARKITGSSSKYVKNYPT